MSYLKVLPTLLALLCLVTHLKALPIVDSIEEDQILSDNDEVTANTIEDSSEDSDEKFVIDLSFFGNAIYGNPDSDSTGSLVANYSLENATVNPEELGSYLEGDILVPKRRESAAGENLGRNGVTSLSSRWPKGIVPFTISSQFSPRDLATIQQAMEEYHRRTCIRFVPRSNERDYVSIVGGNSGCWSSVGRIGGKQEVNLQSPGCLGKPGTAIHELMHALGFLHEQNRMERDNFVTVQYQNIQRHALPNFEKASHTLAYGVPYDYGSVMHYSANAFSSNGRPTMVAKQPGGDAQMGQRNGFSAFDVEKLNKMYECGYGAPAQPAPQPQIPGYPAPSFPGNGPPPGYPVPGPAPGYPGPAPGYPAPGGYPPPNVGGPPPAPNVVGSFLGGLITGLGLGDDNDVNAVTEVANEV